MDAPPNPASNGNGQAPPLNPTWLKKYTKAYRLAGGEVKDGAEMLDTLVSYCDSFQGLMDRVGNQPLLLRTRQIMELTGDWDEGQVAALGVAFDGLNEILEDKKKEQKEQKAEREQKREQAQDTEALDLDLDLELELDLDLDSGDSWAPVDLAAVLAGDRELVKPVMLCRVDGPCLLYAGKVHSFNAEPESGKTWLVVAACAQEIQDGGHAFYIDYESDAAEIVARLLSLGVSKELILSSFHYWNPEDAYQPGAIDGALKRWQPVLCVVDGIGAAMSVQGLKIKDNDDATAFMNALPRHMALTGAAVALTDHVVKRREDRGGFGIGAQAKKATVDVTYELQNKIPFARGSEGRSAIVVTKDRPGAVRAVSEGKRNFGTLVLASSELEQGSVDIRIDGPLRGFAVVVDAMVPSETMEAVSRFLESESGPCSMRDVRAGVAGSGGSPAKDAAIAELVRLGFVENQGNANRAKLVSVKLYRAI